MGEYTPEAECIMESEQTFKISIKYKRKYDIHETRTIFK